MAGFVVDLFFFCAFFFVTSLTILSISVSDESIPAAEVDSPNVPDSSVLKFFEFVVVGCSKVKTEIPGMKTWQAAFQNCSYKYVFLKNWQFLEKNLLRSSFFSKVAG